MKPFSSLIIIKQISSTFTDLSLDLNNYDVDEANISLVNEVDHLYIGLYKKFKNLYIDVKNVTLQGALTFQYWNGTSWTQLVVKDESKSLSRSGFIKWMLPKDWKSTTVDNEKGFFIRATAETDVNLNGINMLFANDDDLREHYRQIREYLGDDRSFVALHQASRKDIIQNIRNSGNTKISSLDGQLSDLTIWDFLEPDQLRNAASYLCLSKIFGGVSDNAEGKFSQLSKMFYKSYQKAEGTFLKTVDKNDDGEKEDSDVYQSVKKTRVILV